MEDATKNKTYLPSFMEVILQWKRLTINKIDTFYSLSKVKVLFDMLI